MNNNNLTFKENQVDVLTIEYMDPRAEQEDWAFDWRDSDEQVCGLRFMINGRELMEIVNEIEIQKCGHAYAYGHAEPWVTSFLQLEDKKGSIYPFCGWFTGEPAECTFWGKWHADDKYVYWYGFHSHALADYGLQFRFEKESYRRTVEADADASTL